MNIIKQRRSHETVVRHVQEKVSTALKAVFVMIKEEIPDRKSDSVIDLKISNGCSDLKKRDGIYRHESTATELQNCISEACEEDTLKRIKDSPLSA
ncbi:unnamed protein product [Pocillopora meandrina]|uniref:Uncharacterized protein n=1 Tax=Pocillopora meandrina TaxID=46732 RepID=A0AAU9VUB7_9CNID|nr:unnamed protein product [Pocillopora meandrina]